MRILCLSAVILALSSTVALARPDRPAPGGADRERAALDRICANPKHAGKSAEDFSGILAKALLLSDAQKATLKDYQDAQAAAISEARSKLCASRPDLSSFEASLNFRQQMLEDELDRVKKVNPKLIAFYNGLNAEQKAKFDEMRRHMAMPMRR